MVRVKPIVLTTNPGFGAVLIRTFGKDFPGVIAYIGKTWKQFSIRPLDCQMLDQKLDKLYANEADLSQLMLFYLLLRYT